MMASKINKSWEQIRTEVHSPVGVEQLKRAVKTGLFRKYTGLIESMFRYEYGSDRFEDMRVMSQDTAPEKFLFRNGECVWFRDDKTNQIHCLPFVVDGGINIYGRPTAWFPVPVGYSDDKKGTYSDEVERIRATRLTPLDSVIMRNNIFGSGDFDYVDNMVNELVDNVLTMNQLQLLAAMPYVFNVTEDNLLTAKNYYLAIAEHRPAIFTNSNGEKPVPAIEKTDVKIDPALFELFDRFECQLLESVGFPCVPITKRAQQSVNEVESHEEMVFTKRQERLKMRELACERISEIFGVTIAVHSVLDEEFVKSNQEDTQQEVNDDIV